jgi:hypothetical protein
MTKSVFVNEYNLAYTEGLKPVYLQIYLVKDGQVEVGFCLADSQEEAMFMGATKGTVVYNTRLIEVFDKLKAIVRAQPQPI